jgi:hypothetical protein
MATLADFFAKKSFAPFILFIFGHHGVKFCPKTKHWFQLLEARKKKNKKKLPDCYILLLQVAKNII